MAIEKREVNVAKELGDVMAMVKNLVKTIKEKGDYSALIGNLISAIDGMGQIDDEFKSDLKACVNTVTLEATEIAFILLEKKVEVAPEVVV